MTRRIKIVVCSWSPSLASGSGRMEAHTVRYLDRNRFEACIVSMRGSDRSAHAHDPETNLQFVGNRDRLSGLMEHLADADIVQFQGGYDPLVCEAAIQCEVPVLIETIHNLEAGGVYPEIDRIVCVSDAVAAFQMNDPRVTVIPNGIELADFPFGASPDTAERIIFLEAARREKPMTHLDELADELLALDPRIELWLAGAGQTLPTSDRVKYLGYQRDTAALFRSATLSFLLTYEEAFGLVAAESMASGTPPIVSSLGALPEVVTNGESGWIVDPKNSQAVVDAARSALALIGSPKFDAMRRAGRARVEEHFTIQRTMAAYEALYLELIEEKGLRRSAVRRAAVKTAEAEIGDAMFAYHERHNFLIVSTFERLVKRGELLRFRESFVSAQALVRILPLEALADLFHQSCLWLQQHPWPLSYELVQVWLKAVSDRFSPASLAPSLINHAPSAPELLLEGVALALERRDKSTAEALLRGAIDVTTDAETKTVYLDWHGKVGNIRG